MYNGIQKVGAVVSIGRVGKISANVISALNLSVAPDTPIYIGKTNIDHMLSSHPDDYVKYGIYIREIIATPEYVGQNPKDSSIEYVKEFQVDGEFVKVAVRVSTRGQYFARSICAEQAVCVKLHRKRHTKKVDRANLIEYNSISTTQ